MMAEWTAPLSLRGAIYRRRLARSLAFEAPPAQPDGQWVCAVSVALGLAFALVVWGFGGYHAGFSFLNGLTRDVEPGVLASVTYAGDSLFALVLMLVFTRRYPRLVWTAVIAALIATLLSQGLKHLTDLARPAAVLAPGSFELVGPAYRRHSFPSGHATTAFLVATVFAAYLPAGAGRYLALLLGTLVGLSRVAVGVHWPVDVAAGAVVGGTATAIALWLTPRWRWGLNLTGHLVIVGLLSGCALAMLVTELPYPDAEPFARTTAALAITIAVWNYVLRPLKLLRLGGWLPSRKVSLIDRP